MKIQEIIKELIIENESIEKFLYDNHTYGFSAALIDEGKLSETFEIGLNQRINQDTVFQAASVSKSVFATTVMKLHESGMVDLDEDFSSMDYLKDYTYKGKRFKITLKDLLTHTAGFNVHGFSGYLKSQKLPSLEEILTGIRPANSLKLQIVEEPHKMFRYSGGGYMLAQYIIENKTGKSYMDWADELVFKPLGMKNSTLSMPLDHKRENFAVGWTAYDTEIDQNYLVHPELAAAGLWTTPSDLCLFGMEFMKALEGESQWLSQKSAQIMLTKPEDIDTEYAMGFQIHLVRNNLVFGHGGDNTGYHGGMIFCPTKKRGIVAMVNSEIGQEIPNKIAEIFLNHL